MVRAERSSVGATAPEPTAALDDAAAKPRRVKRPIAIHPEVSGAAGPLSRRRHLGAAIMMLVGGGLAAVGLVDLLLLWLPVRFGSPAWEFATISRTLEGAPQIAVGLGLLAYGMLRHPSRPRRALRLLSVIFGAGAAMLLVAGGLYMTVAPAVVAGAPDEASAGLQRTLIKSAVHGLVYLLVYAGAATLLWRGTRREH